MNPIGWCRRTLNPFYGCTHGCCYCYARRQAKRRKGACDDCYEFRPHFHLERLAQLTPRQRPSRVFLGSMSDLADFTDPKYREGIAEIFGKVYECSQHAFLFLTKRPMEFSRALPLLPDNAWAGVTINKAHDLSRLNALLIHGASRCLNYFVSFEPLTGPITYCDILEGWGGFAVPKWFIIGGLSRPGGQGPAHPPTKWLDGIIQISREFDIPVYMKDNLGWLDGKPWREFPAGMPVYPGEEQRRKQP